mmetsp:Transcript_10939/g.26824  ORF Transcript_10939/g.26824 Transcript_10939/m.26824 type:complete len:201 (-) Transcript_10939:2322-2924(-)
MRERDCTDAGKAGCSATLCCHHPPARAARMFPPGRGRRRRIFSSIGESAARCGRNVFSRMDETHATAATRERRAQAVSVSRARAGAASRDRGVGHCRRFLCGSHKTSARARGAAADRRCEPGTLLRTVEVRHSCIRAYQIGRRKPPHPRIRTRAGAAFRCCSRCVEARRCRRETPHRSPHGDASEPVPRYHRAAAICFWT